MLIGSRIFQKSILNHGYLKFRLNNKYLIKIDVFYKKINSNFKILKIRV